MARSKLDPPPPRDPIDKPALAFLVLLVLAAGLMLCRCVATGGVL